MPLYEVRVAHVSTRYVDAPDRATALQIVQDSIVDSMDLTAHKADPVIARLWSQADEHQRRRLLLRLDGMIGTVGSRAHAEVQRRLERHLEHQAATAAWVQSAQAAAPPINPDSAQRLAMVADAAHRRWLIDRLT